VDVAVATWMGLRAQPIRPTPSLPDRPSAGSASGRDRAWPGLAWPELALPDNTARAIKVVDGSLEVVSEGHWTKFAPVRRSDSAGGAPGRRSSPRCTARPE